jgi:hypothetical protein
MFLIFILTIYLLLFLIYYLLLLFFFLFFLLFLLLITLTSYLLFTNTIFYFILFIFSMRTRPFAKCENQSDSQILCPMRTAKQVLTHWEPDWKPVPVFNRRVRIAQHCYIPNMVWYKHDMLMLSRLWTWLSCIYILNRQRASWEKKHVAVLSILLALKTLGLFSIFFPIPPPLDVITDFFSKSQNLWFLLTKNLGKFWISILFSIHSTNLLIIWKFSPKFLHHILN